MSIFSPFFDHTIRKWQSAKTSQQYFVIVQNGAKYNDAQIFFFHCRQFVRCNFLMGLTLKTNFLLINKFSKMMSIFTLFFVRFDKRPPIYFGAKNSKFPIAILFLHIVWKLLKIFQFWHFPPIFVLLKLTCLVTLFDRKLQVFKNSPKWTIFGIFN